MQPSHVTSMVMKQNMASLQMACVHIWQMPCHIILPVRWATLPFVQSYNKSYYIKLCLKKHRKTCLRYVTTFVNSLFSLKKKKLILHFGHFENPRYLTVLQKELHQYVALLISYRQFTNCQANAAVQCLKSILFLFFYIPLFLQFRVT